MVEIDIKKVPEWYTKLDDIPPLPPKPYGGWGRWWRDNSDQLWIILFFAGVTLAVYVVQAEYNEFKARRLTRTIVKRYRRVDGSPNL